MGNIICQSTSKSQSWASRLVTKLNAWWCGKRSTIEKKKKKEENTWMTFVWLSLSTCHGLEYHYNKGKKLVDKKVLFHMETWIP